MNEQTLEKLKEIFTPIASKIGQTADFGWEVVMRQQYVVSIQGLLLGLLGIAFFLVAYWCAKNAKKWDVNYNPIGYIGASCFGTAGMFLVLFGLDQFITHILNPQFYAIEFFMNLVK